MVINHQRRWDNRYLALKRYQTDGHIGSLQAIQISFGGGRLCRGGSHLFDLALMFADNEVMSGFGWLSNPGDFDPGGIGIFETSNGIRFTIDGSIGMNHSYQVDLIGKDGILRIIDGGLKFEAWILDSDSEFGLIKPIIKELYEGLTEEHRIKGYERALKYKGSACPILKDFTDMWYIMYCISNYRVDWVGIDSSQDRQELHIMKNALINVAKKSHKNFQF